MSDPSVSDHESEMSFLNMKRMYDEYQALGLDGSKRSQSFHDMLSTYFLARIAERDKLSTLSISNAIDTANLINKQAAAHRDIAIDNQWGIDQSAYFLTKDQTFQSAIEAAVAKAVNSAMGKTNPAPQATP